MPDGITGSPAGEGANATSGEALARPNPLRGAWDIVRGRCSRMRSPWSRRSWPWRRNSYGRLCPSERLQFGRPEMRPRIVDPATSRPVLKRFIPELRQASLVHLFAMALASSLFWGEVGVGNAQERYLVGSGDRLNIEVYQIGELNRRALVDVDGNVHFLTIGALKVAGLSLEEIRERLTALLRSNGTLNNPQVLVELAETRPVYISGDVSKPGEYEYRPGMSIRQLVAVAGGYDVLHFRANSPFIQLPDFQAERDTLWLELARQEIRIALLRAELAGQADASVPRLDDFPIPARILAEALQLEQQLALARRAERDRLKSHLQRMIARADEQIAALQEQRRQEEQNIRQLTEDVAQAQALYSRGLAQLSRIQEQQRSMAFSHSRLAESIANIALASRSREEFVHRIQSLDEERRIELIEQIERGSAQAVALQLRLNSATEKALYAGALRSQLLGGARSGVELVVHRRSGNPQARVISSEDTTLMPGDAVEVTLKLER